MWRQKNSATLPLLHKSGDNCFPQHHHNCKVFCNNAIIAKLTSRLRTKSLFQQPTCRNSWSHTITLQSGLRQDRCCRGMSVTTSLLQFCDAHVGRSNGVGGDRSFPNFNRRMRSTAIVSVTPHLLQKRGEERGWYIGRPAARPSNGQPGGGCI